MSIYRRPAVYALGIVAVAVVGWVGLAPAKSRPWRDDADRQCSARVKELEAEVISLREQVRELSVRQGNAPLGRSTRISRLNAAATRQTKNGQGTPCEPPFAYDKSGIKFYRPECLDSQQEDACSVPYTYTNTGIKVYKPDCLDKPSDTSSSCDSPFTYDAQGIKTFKTECL